MSTLRGAFHPDAGIAREVAAVRPGATTADIVRLWPTATEFGFPDEEAAFGLQYGHGVGLSIWEKPIFSRLVSLSHPEPIEEGVVFALETYWPSADGVGAARIEEELVVTATAADHAMSVMVRCIRATRSGSGPAGTSTRWNPRSR